MNIVKELRKRAGIQQKELALIVGVAQPTVSEWELNKKDPSGDRLKKLAEYFNVDELVILGKGVVDLSSAHEEKPHSKEAEIVSGAIDRMPQEKREKAVNIMRMVFSEYFEKEEDKIS